MRLLVTGGAGFIGSNFIHLVLARRPGWEVVNLDKLTYAGNLDNLRAVEKDLRYRFVRGDICDEQVVNGLVPGCDAIVNFAAETHVDRSIGDPASFLRTDVFGVHVLLEAARRSGLSRFLQISTDEVYGSIEKGAFRETDPLNPSSPYSASKAAGELLARSYWVTYQTPVLITRGANNIGPYQYPEKVVPLFITNALEGKELPIYGDGLQVRDYMYVGDHCEGLLTVLERGEPGEIYNVGAGNEMANIDMARFLLRALGKPESFLRHVTDRPGHDRRYAIDSSKLRALGWEPKYGPEQALQATVDWYVAHPEWWQPIKSGEFRKFYEQHYANR